MAGFSDVLVGLQWGDEGKGRFIDYLLDSGLYSIVARFNGGPNAGHTLNVNGKNIALHGLPSGVFHPKIHLYIGAGCVINPEKLLAEIREVESLGVSLDGRLHISAFASIIQPHHILEDLIYGAHLGTTGNGIGPAYAQRMMRSLGPLQNDLRFAHAMNSMSDTQDIARVNLMQTIATFGTEKVKSKHRYENEFVGMASIPPFMTSVAQLKKYLERDALWLTKQVSGGSNVLFEGAQAFMIDITYGGTPFTTSSSTIAAGAYTGGDLSNRFHRKTMGVIKAIPSRVGAGPFVAELGGKRSEDYCMEDGGKKHTKEFEAAHYDPNEALKSNDEFNLGVALRMLGGEYGATTKRPRRIGVLDLPQLQYAAKFSGTDELYITKIDQLPLFNNTLFRGPAVVESYQMDNTKIHHHPITTAELADAKPYIYNILSRMPTTPISSNWNELPEPVVSLVEMVERACDTKVMGLGIGPEREKVVFRTQ